MFGMFKRGKSKPPADVDEPVVLTPVPPLVALLAQFEQEKGQPLTEAQVNEIRDNCACISLPLTVAKTMAEARGYDDLDPELVWEQWQVVREQL